MSIRVNNAPSTLLVDAAGGSSDVEEAVAEQVFPMGADIELSQHLTRDMFARPQTVRIDFDLVASPAELAQSPGKATWKLLPHLLKQLKQNLALKNRHMPSDAELAGNLHRCIPLHLEIVQQKNDLPFFMGIEMPGMMNTNLHKHGQCVWRVPPDTPTMLVGKPAFEPVNVVNQFQYNNLRRVTDEDLYHAVQLHPAKGKTPAHAMVLVGSLAYKMIEDNLVAGNWAEELEHFDVDTFFNPPRGQLRVQVSEKMGKQVIESLETPLKEARESFVDLNDFVVSFVRADGVDSFESPKNINGELIGTSQKGVNTKVLNTTRLQKRGTFHIKADFTFLLF